MDIKKFREEISLLLNEEVEDNVGIIYTHEERRFLNILKEIITSKYQRNIQVTVFDSSVGEVPLDNYLNNSFQQSGDRIFLEWIRTTRDNLISRKNTRQFGSFQEFARNVYVIFNSEPLWSNYGRESTGANSSYDEIIRLFKTMVYVAKDLGDVFFFVTASDDIPEAIRKISTFLVMPLPNLDELQSIAEEKLKKANISASDDLLKRIAFAVLGLTEEEAKKGISKIISISQDKGIRIEELIDRLEEEKKRVIAENGALRFYENPEEMSRVGGLKILKEWIRKRAHAFQPNSKLPQPRGILLVGIPGTGKSLSAKAISKELKIPLIQLDMGALFGRYLGESEQRTRDALNTVESVAPCVLWIDEIEKGVGQQSGGEVHEVTMRVIGTILTWMQEREAPVFIVATSNDITKLPPEFTRKGGRFDEIFFVDLPSKESIAEILEILLKIHNLGNLLQSLQRNYVSKDTTQFSRLVELIYRKRMTGAEIEQAILNSFYSGYNPDNNSVNVDFKTLYNEIDSIVPFATVNQNVVASLRDWAKRSGVKVVN